MVGLWVIVFVLVVSCAAVPVRQLPKQNPTNNGFGSAKRVLVIGVDGFGGMYMENSTSFLPTFAELLTNGAHTTRARNQMPTMSAPNWATIITGMGPEETGVFSNDWVPADDNVTDPTVELMPPVSGAGKIPETMWAVAKNNNSAIKIAVSISWDWIVFLTTNDTVDELFLGNENDQAVTDKMVEYIKSDDPPELMFVHLDAVDDAGHATYWGSPTYYDAAKGADAMIAQLLGALSSTGLLGETLVMVTADHGGWRNTHGQSSQACFYVPLIFYGAGVSTGAQLTGYDLTNKDIAPTVLHALGVPPGNYMVGHVIDQVFA